MPNENDEKLELVKDLLRARNPFVEIYYKDPEKVKKALEKFIDLHLKEKKINVSDQ